MPQGFPYDRLVETIDRRHRAIVAGAVVLLVVSA